ncbi:nucleotide exchange factor GrpE [bacterium]|nr:nucleotide exchange factor GrpE [bacterium]
METEFRPDSEEDIKTELDKFRDLAYRSAAELENYRRRVAKDQEDLTDSLKERFAAQLVPVLDAFDLAGMNPPAGTDEVKKYIEGYQAIGRQVAAALDRLGVKEIAVSNNAEFRPAEQEAVVTEEVPGLKSPMVLEVLQKGYSLNGRLIRPARVKVGMPGTEKPEEGRGDLT